jgi:ribonucleoside-triphosphate reductase
MGCRSFLGPWKDENGKYKWYGRFNQGVVTLNLVDVGLSAEKDLDQFWKILDARLELCFQALMMRHERLLNTPTTTTPIHWKHGGLARLEGENFNELLFNGYSSISLGYAGLYECVLALTGESHTTHNGEKLALKIMRHLRATTDRWKKETTIGFSLYGTPLESTTDKLARCLKKRFGIVEGVTDHDYVTNSYHVNVTEKIDAFDKLKFESQFQNISSGGAISYVETCNLSNNIDVILQLITFMYNNIQYAELNGKFDYCQACGFAGEMLLNDDNEWYCPNCGNMDHNKLNIARRTCGYIGDNFWNKGRTAEIKDRFVHVDNEEADSDL